MPNTRMSGGGLIQECEEFIQLASQRMSLLETAENLGPDGVLTHWPALLRLRALAMRMNVGHDWDVRGFQPALLASDGAVHFMPLGEPWRNEDLDSWDLTACEAQLDAQALEARCEAAALDWIAAQHRGASSRRYTPNADDAQFAQLVWPLILDALPARPVRGAHTPALISRNYFCCGQDSFIVSAGDEALVLYYGMFC